MKLDINTYLACFELGYVACEKGNNMYKAKLEFLKIFEVTKEK